MEIKNFTLRIVWLVIFSFGVEFVLGWIGVLFHNVGLVCFFGVFALIFYFDTFFRLNRRIKNLEKEEANTPSKIYNTVRKNYFLQIGFLAFFAGQIRKVDTFFVNKIIENPLHAHISLDDIVSLLLPIGFAFLAFLKDCTTVKPGGSGRSTWFFTQLGFVTSGAILLSGVYGGVAFQAAEDIFRFSWEDWWVLSSYRTDAARTLSLIFGNVGFAWWGIVIPVSFSIVDLKAFIIQWYTTKKASPLFPIATKIAMQLYVVYIAISVFTSTSWLPDFIIPNLNKIEEKTFALEQVFNKCLNNGGGNNCYTKMASELKTTRNLEETEILSNVTTKEQKENFQTEKSRADILRNSHLALLGKEFVTRPDKEIILLQEEIRYEKQRTKELFYRWIRCNGSHSSHLSKEIQPICEEK